MAATHLDVGLRCIKYLLCAVNSLFVVCTIMRTAFIVSRNIISSSNLSCSAIHSRVEEQSRDKALCSIVDDALRLLRIRSKYKEKVKKKIPLTFRNSRNLVENLKRRKTRLRTRHEARRCRVSPSKDMYIVGVRDNVRAL